MIPTLVGVLPDVDDETRAELSLLIDMRGLPAAKPLPPREPEVPAEVIKSIRSETDVTVLSSRATSETTAIAHEAILRLLEFGEKGRGALVTVLEGARSAERMRPLLDSVPLWDDGEALERLRGLASSERLSAELRCRIAMGLAERGDDAFGEIAIQCVIENHGAKRRDSSLSGGVGGRSPLTMIEAEAKWFTADDWIKLCAVVGNTTRVARVLCAAAHPHAYIRAVQHELASDDGRECMAALRAFLEQGTERMGSLRRLAACHLHARGDYSAFSIVMASELDAHKGSSTLLVGVPAFLVHATTDAYLVAGHILAKEPSLLHHLAPKGVELYAKEDAYESILLRSSNDSVRQSAAHAVRTGFSRMRKLRRVAETFAWGVKVGQELTGRKFKVQMTGGGSLGHTRFNENRVHVTPLPLMRQDRFGREIVEALILHELGHHIYHRGPQANKVWGQAQKEGLHGLLNLVADEHLERNLRAMDAEFGDKLKRLAAFAFQHTSRELAVQRVLGHVGAHAFEVLTETHLGVARDAPNVLIHSGSFLFSMEKKGLAFSRFVRALRMGLGNRHDDPLVAQALALFDGRFRHRNMVELMDITRKLRDMFGWEVQLCESFGSHESLENLEGEEIVWGEGITQDEIDREVERVLDPRTQNDTNLPVKPGGRPWLNVNPKEDFARITNVQRVPFDSAIYGEYAHKVARAAAIMRRYLEELGLARVPRQMRLRGYRIDRSRIPSLVLRGDPRVLIARENKINTDLFLGMVVDCSGSMSSRDNMERARLFGTLLAEAARPMLNVDLRVFGFTDQVLFDCGDAKRCAVPQLKAGGGNNDAAALYHAATAAKESRRKAKLLVMISDGLPTECSVAALRGLVQTLTRRHHMVCAQAAVQPLAEVCFPHYVVLNDESIEVSVKKFGNVIARLVQKALIG